MPVAEDVTEDGLMGGRVRMLQPRRGYRVAVDAVLLAASIDAREGERVLDLGAGVGAVGLCLAARTLCQVVGIELQAELARLAERNAALNNVTERVRTIVHDLALPLPADLGEFDHVAANPPYLPAARADPSPDRSKALATVESSVGLAGWLEIAASTAKAGGTITLIHRLERVEEITSQLLRLGWGTIAVKRLPPAARVLVQARRSPTPKYRDSPPLTLHNPSGGYSAEAEAILRHAAPLAF
jgi:tRNA1(Val) A37 N6-methylase TrmN6